MANSYLLRYNGMLRPIESTASLGKNTLIRMLKPADDRKIKINFKIGPEDYETWRVIDTDTVTQENPLGGFEDVTILELERYYDKPKPGEPFACLGG